MRRLLSRLTSKPLVKQGPGVSPTWAMGNSQSDG